MALPRDFFAPSFRHRQLGRFFAVLVGIMVYLATFSTAAEATLSAATLTWDRGMATRLTVEIPAVGDEASVPQEDRVRQTLAVLRAMPDVARAVQLTDDEIENLLKPWISQPELLKALPIPTLIDVERKPGTLMTADDIRRQIKAAVPDARVDDHGEWLSDLAHLVQGLALLGGLMIFLTALALILAVSLVCRAIMTAEREMISLLHIMGAADDDIALHFAYHASRLSVPAALGGFLLAIASAGAILFFLRYFVDPGMIPLTYWGGLGLGVTLVPIAAIGITSISARLSVRSDLNLMP